jgi:hypothetical protein
VLWEMFGFMRARVHIELDNRGDENFGACMMEGRKSWRAYAELVESAWKSRRGRIIDNRAAFIFSAY